MNQTCKVCGEPAAGFHFGAFTCEGCKSFFGRSYNNNSSISECKNNGKCIIDKKNRTTCKACRLRKCYRVGMSKSGSRYGRRSNWFKIHCLLQEQQQQAGGSSTGFGDMAAVAAAAQQHMQQRNSHLAAAQHMGGSLGYPGYLPDMMQGMSPFMSAAAAAAARHPVDAAAALPFFSMINSLPSIGSPQSAFQLPPHLLFSGYHHGSAAAADAAYRAEMYKHRQSVDSAASGESSQHYSPAAVRTHSAAANEYQHIRDHSPELCVSGDDDEHTQCEQRSAMSQHSVSPVSSAHTIHSPIAIRATPTDVSPVRNSNSIVTAADANTNSSTSLAIPQALHTPAATPSPVAAVVTAEQQATLSFTAKMQSLSPVSVCSIGVETTITAAVGTSVANDQESPMDLSMKTSRSSVHSFNTSAGESDAQSDFSEEDAQRQSQAVRRKFYHFTAGSEHESDASSDASAAEAVKRQKLATDVVAAQNYNGFAHNTRGIFVCV